MGVFPRTIAISTIIILLSAGFCSSIFADDTNGNGHDDLAHFTDNNNDGFDDQHPFPQPTEIASSLLIIGSENPLAYFGFYRTTQMTEPGWTLLRRTLDWALGLEPGSQENILLFTYNNDFEPPIDYLQEDSYAVFNWLTDQPHSNITTRPQWDMPGLSIEYYQSFDLILYWNTYCYDAASALASGVPFISICPGHAQDMNLGTMVTLHNIQEQFCVVNNDFYPTQPFELREITFEESMWVNGMGLASEGVALVQGFCPTTATETKTLGDMRSMFR